MIRGSCKCQAVSYAFDGDEQKFGVITICHCGDCRKLQGGAGVIAVPVEAQYLRWITGKPLITEFESSPGKKRAFCSRCGTPLYSRRDDRPQTLRLRIGSIDTPTAALPQAHIHCSRLPPWASLDLTLPRYSHQEPGRREPSPRDGDR